MDAMRAWIFLVRAFVHVLAVVTWVVIVVGVEVVEVGDVFTFVGFSEGAVVAPVVSDALVFLWAVCWDFHSEPPEDESLGKCFCLKT